MGGMLGKKTVWSRPAVHVQNALWWIPVRTFHAEIPSETFWLLLTTTVRAVADFWWGVLGFGEWRSCQRSDDPWPGRAFKTSCVRAAGVRGEGRGRLWDQNDGLLSSCVSSWSSRVLSYILPNSNHFDDFILYTSSAWWRNILINWDEQPVLVLCVCQADRLRRLMKSRGEEEKTWRNRKREEHTMSESAAPSQSVSQSVGQALTPAAEFPLLSSLTMLVFSSTQNIV